MWRATLLASLLLTLALGVAADAKCRVCIESITTDRANGLLSISVAALSDEGAKLPESATLTFTKGVQVPLTKTGTGTSTQFGGLPTAIYTGTTTSHATGPLVDLTGKVDIAGDIFTFVVPGVGKGTTQLVTAGSATEFAQQAVVPTANIVAVSQPAPAPAPSFDGAWAVWLGLAALAAGTAIYFGRGLALRPTRA